VLRASPARVHRAREPRPGAAPRLAGIEEEAREVEEEIDAEVEEEWRGGDETTLPSRSGSGGLANRDRVDPAPTRRSPASPPERHRFTMEPPLEAPERTPAAGISTRCVRPAPCHTRPTPSGPGLLARAEAECPGWRSPRGPAPTATSTGGAHHRGPETARASPRGPALRGPRAHRHRARSSALGVTIRPGRERAHPVDGPLSVPG
jgi:hypothetical protein